MGIPVLIMAGGRSTRFDFEQVPTTIREKALLKLGSKCFIELILEAALSARNVDQIYVAVTQFTTKTREFLMKLPKQVKICDTIGKGYHEDLISAVKQLKLGVVLTIGADIPLLKNTHLDQVINEYWICQKPALAVMNRPAKHEAQGLSATMMLDSPENKEKLVPVGINILDGHLTDLPEQEQAIYVLEDETLLFNINTVTDYKILTSKYGSGKV